MEAKEATPASFMFAASKLNVDRNKFKIVPSSAVAGAAYSVLSFQIPQGTVVDLQSLKLYLQIATASPGTAGVDPDDRVYARLPADITTMLQQVQVLCNGILIGGSCTEYNSAYRLRKICASTFGRDQTIDRAVSHSTITSANENESGEFVIKDWLHTIFAGGREGASTRYLHTGVVGDITVRIQFSGNQVLVPKRHASNITADLTADAKLNAAQMTWSYSDAYATIDCLSMPPAYEAMLMRSLEIKSLELDYEEAYCSSLNNITGDAFDQRFSVSTRSLNKLFSGVRDANYNTVGIKAGSLPDAIGDAVVSNYQRFRVYPGPQYENNLWNYSLNGQLHPNYPAKLLEACSDIAYVEDKMGVSGDGVLMSSYADWKDGYGVWPLRLDVPLAGDAHPQTRMASGFDSRSTNAAMSFAVRGMSAPGPPVPATGETGVRACLTVAVTQPTLIISAGKSITVSW